MTDQKQERLQATAHEVGPCGVEARLEAHHQVFEQSVYELRDGLWLLQLQAELGGLEPGLGVHRWA